MGRHHKPSDLSSSSSYPTGLNRRSVTIREVRCCIWWPANIPLAVIVCFIVFCLWQLPEDHDEYPDGFTTCPNSTNRILDHRNVTIGCKSCLECPVGQQLLPPCGSTIQSETSIVCKKCPPNTYKESQGVGKCKPCQTCGIRETISPCTPEKNTLCGRCPRGYYQEDYMLDSCKRCSTCCNIKHFAELECIYLKQCVRKNCTQQLKIKESSVLKSVDFANLFATESTGHERAARQQHASQSDNQAHARNWVLEDIVTQLKKAQFRREAKVTMLSITRGKNASQVVEETSTDTLKGNNSNPITIAFDEGNYGIATLSTPPSKLQEGFGTTFEASTSKPTLQLTSNKSGNDNKQPTLLIVLVAGFVGIAIMLILLGVIILVLVLKMKSGHFPGGGCTITCCAKYISIDGNEYQPILHDTSQTDSDCQQIPHISNNGVDTYSEKSERWWPDDLASLPLGDLSPTLENGLIKRLDVRHKGEYGWKKLGNAFDVDKDDLKYLETAYQRSVESPTKDLLDILDKSQCRTVGEVLNELKGSYVNRPDVAQFICQKWQETKYDKNTK